jgi:hypothetical protein
MALDLRPLTLGELLDRSFSIYRRHFWLFVGIMAVPSVLALAMSLLMILAAASLVPSTEPGSPLDIGRMIWVVGIVCAIAVTLAVYFVTYSVALGATTIAVSQIYLDRPGTIRSTFTALRGKVGRLTLLFLLVAIRVFGVAFLAIVGVIILAAIFGLVSPILSGVIVVAGMMAVVGLVFWFVLRYAVTVPVAVLEDESATDSIGRSVQLTEGSRGRVFVLLLFTIVIAYAVLLIFQGPFAAVGMMAGPDTATYFWANLLSSISGAVGSALTSPLTVVAYAVLYYDLRVRKEGLDLDVMLGKLGPAGTDTH